MSAEIGIRITGDSKDFEAALARSGAAVDAFGRKAGDGLGGIVPKTQQATAVATGLRDTLISFAVGGTILGAFTVVASQVGQVASALLEAQIQADRLGNSLKFTFGQAGAARETAYLRDVTRELGQEYLTSAQSYGKLAAASRGTNLEGKATRDIFEAIAGASTVMGLSVEQSNGALQAITQIISKGTVQSEELRGQLGERLPGAFQIAARAMGVTTAELGKMLEQGQVISEDFLPKFAAQLKKELGDSTVESANSAQAAVNNLSSSWGLAKEELAKAGLGEFIKGQLNILTDGFDNVSQSVRQSREEGDGFFGLLGAGGGALLQFLNPLNAVSFGASSTAGQLAQAKERLAELQKSLETPGAYNVTFLRPAIKETEELIARLEAARQVQKELASPLPSQGDVRSAEIRQQQINAEQAAKRELAAGSYLKKYATDAEKLAAELRKAKTELGEFFSPDIERRIRASFNKKTLSDPFIAGRDAAKAYADAVGDFQKIQALAEGKTNDLSKAQERLVEYLKSAVYAQHSESMREVVLQAAFAAIKAEQAADAYKDFNKALAESDAARLKGLTAGDEANEKLEEQNNALREEIELIGLSEVQQFAVIRARNESTIALKEERLARLQALDIGREEQVQLAKEIRLLKERNTLQGVKVDRTAAASALEELNAEAKRFNEEVERSLTDALLRGFEKGEGFVRNFIDTLKNLFKTLVLTPTIKAIIQPVAGALTGALGVAGPANAATGSNLLSTASNAYSLANIGSTFASTAGALGGVAGAEFAANFIGAVGGDAIGALATGLQASGAVAGSAFASAALNAVPYVAAAAVVASALGLFRSNKIVDGGISGTLGGQVNDYALNRRGGTLFSGPDYSVRDQGVSAQNESLQKAYSAIRNTVAGMAEQLGIGNDAIKAFTVQLGNDLIHPDTGGFGIKTQGLSQDEIVKKIEAALVSANDQLAAFALGTTEFSREGESAAQTLGRLAGSLQTVNGTFALLGLSLADASLAGADAASKFIDLFGGVEQFNQATASYYQNFTSEAERTANTVAALTAEFGALGLTLPATREEYRALVTAQSALGESASPTVAKLIQLGDAFSAFTQTIDETQAETLAALANFQFGVADALTAQLDANNLRSANLQGQRALQQADRDAALSLADAFESVKSEAEQASKSLRTVALSAGEYDANSALVSFVDTAEREIDRLRGIGAPVDKVTEQLGQGVVALSQNLAQSRVLAGDIVGAQGAIGQVIDTINQYGLDLSREGRAPGAFTGIGSTTNGREIDRQLLRVLGDNALQSTNLEASINTLIARLSEGGSSGFNTGGSGNFSDVLIGLQSGNNSGLAQAGINSLYTAFGQIGDAAAELSATASDVAPSINSVEDAVGRLNSAAFLFETSAEAIRTGIAGSENFLTNFVEGLRSAPVAEAAAEAARQLASILTTRTALEAQNALSGLDSFDGLDSDALRSISLLVQGVSQFNNAGVEDAFVLLTNALNTGAVSAEQYADLIQYVEDVYLGTATAIEGVADAARSAQDILNERLGLERQLLELNGDTVAIRALERAAIDETNLALYDQIQALRDQQTAAAEAAQAATAIASEREGLERQLLEAQGNSVAILALQRNALDESNRALFDQVQAAQAATAAANELAAAQERSANERLSLEQQLLQLQGNTAELRRRELEALDPINRAFQEQINFLEDAASAQQAATQAAEQAAQAAQAAYERQQTERLNLEGQVLQLLGDTATLRQRELEALDPANRALQELVYTLQDQQAAAQELAAAQERITSERTSLEQQLLEAQGNSAALLERQRNALDASNQALFDQVHAAQAATAAANELAAAQERITSERLGLERQLLEAQGDTTALRLLERDALDETNRALFDQVQAAQSAATAAQELAATQERITSERAGLEQRLLQVQGNTTALRALELAALDESNRAILEEIFRLEDAAAAANGVTGATDNLSEALAAQERILQERLGLENRLLQLQGNTAELRRRELGELDASNRSILEEIFRLEDQATATAQAAAAQDAYNAAIERTKSAVNTIAGQIEGFQNRATQALDAVAAVQFRVTGQYVEAQNAVMAAQGRVNQLNDAAADSLRGLGRSIQDFVTGLAVTEGGGLLNQRAALESQFAISAAQARAGDQGAAERLTGLAQQLFANFEQTSTGQLDLLRSRGLLINQLTDIGTELAGNPVADPLSEIAEASNALVAAQAELARLAILAAQTGASTSAATEDLLAEYRTARDAQTLADSELQQALTLTQGINLAQLTELETLNQNIAEYLSAQAAAGGFTFTPDVPGGTIAPPVIAPQQNNAAPAQSNTELVAELRRVNEKLVAVESRLARIATASEKSADVLDRADNGNGVRMVPA